MEKYRDLESQPGRMAARSETPLLSTRGSTMKTEPAADSLSTRMRLRPARDPYWRLKLLVLSVTSTLIALTLFIRDPPVHASLRNLRNHLVTPSTGSAQASASESSNKIIQVKTLPHHLIPKTYHHHSSSNRRLVIVGDVHGVHKELKDLLSHISFNSSTDHLVLAGDMINKGPASHDVVSLIRSLNASAVRGNHEDKILQLREQLDADPLAFIDDHSRDLQVAKQLSKKDVEWLKECPLILRLGRLTGSTWKETVVAHAGLIPLLDLEKQKPFDVMHMRSISRLTGKGKGKKKHSEVRFQAFEDRNEGDDPWWKVWNEIQKELKKSDRTFVVYGHDAHTGFIEKDWSMGLDSACVTGGKLSALIIEGVDEKTGVPRAKVESVKCKTYM